MKIRAFACLLLAVSVVANCSRKVQEPPVATVSVSMHHNRVPLGSPVDMKYRFIVAPGTRIEGDYRVFVHFLDGSREMMFADDHFPEVPTSQWKPGQTIEYSRTMFVPVYPYTGEATVEVGLYQTNGKRLTLAANDKGHQSYEVSRLQMLAQTENIFLIYKDGWYPTEVAAQNATTDWQWTKKEATLAFRNPKKDVLFYLHVDRRPMQAEVPTVTVQVGDQVVESFQATGEIIKKIPLTAAQLGTGEMAELKIAVDKTFVPAVVPSLNSRDSRELGVCVFHAFVEAR